MPPVSAVCTPRADWETRICEGMSLRTSVVRITTSARLGSSPYEVPSHEGVTVTTALPPAGMEAVDVVEQICTGGVKPDVTLKQTS